MLVIARKAGESFGVGDSIVITVVSVCGDKVRLGIEADRSIPVVRDDAIRRKPRAPIEEDMIRTPDQRVTFPPEIDPIGQ